MLVKVRYGESQKYVKVAETEEGYESYSTFLQKVVLQNVSHTLLESDLSDTSFSVTNASSSAVSDSSDARIVLERDSGVHADRESAKEMVSDVLQGEKKSCKSMRQLKH
ncbi:hypothetical protein CgunFtcFv8_003194 [Champsocephalus gunnari]|uniref:Uncharacterized protein n=1 Tax=Champsocephalus gunnari TaxID=52237 RepID=A0AAN8HKA7_CHAGU|nr:hypothetical protein CgunFtcFv8_003194 [Champsocephalus gunnari]